MGNNRDTIRNCYAGGNVTGHYEVAGLVGRNEGTISNCYSTGRVMSSVVAATRPQIGGLVGSKGESSGVDSSFWDTQTSRQLTSSGGTGKSTPEMKTADTFVNAGWDFSTPIWRIEDGFDYPRLWWEQQPSEYGGGSGTAEDPFLIYTAQQMNAIGANSDDWDKHFKLVADIDLSAFTGTDFNIIGYYVSDNDQKPFTGVFDGNEHTISNFTYTSTDRDFAGIFGFVEGPNAKIKNLGLIDPNVDDQSWFIGSLAGYNNGGTITGCYAQGGAVAGAVRVGGLVGLNDGTMTHCYSTCSVFGGGNVGGMVGLSAGTVARCYSQGSVSGLTNVAGLAGQNDGTITACYATGNVTGSVQTAGGLVGFNQSGNISDCYATGGVSGDLLVGGLVGWNHEIITRCYATGSVTGNTEVGGLVGLNQDTVTWSCWDVQTSGQTTSSGGAGLTTAQMKRESTFIDGGWDFVNEAANGTEDIWWIAGGQDYPRLAWELIEGEPLEAEDSVSVAMDTILIFTTGGSAEWFSQVAISYHDGDAARSGDITHDEESWLQTTLSGPGTLSFYWRVSSETLCDLLEFHVDGSLQNRISGSADWRQMTYEIAESGLHTLEWRYTKDSGTDARDDCGWVDRVEWAPGT